MQDFLENKINKTSDFLSNTSAVKSLKNMISPLNMISLEENQFSLKYSAKLTSEEAVACLAPLLLF